MNSHAGSLGKNSHWSWPVDLTKYDRTPHLRQAEQEELEMVMRLREAGSSHFYQMATHLQRLFQPVTDALMWTGAGETAGSVLSVIVQEMHQRQIAFWGWSQADWIGVLCFDAPTFHRRYHKPLDTRQHLLAVGYLLCDFRAIHAVGHLQQVVFASKVFGSKNVEESIQHVSSELLNWGYGTDRARDHLANTLCEALLFNRSPNLEDLTTEVLEAVRQEHIARYLKTNIPLLSRALVGLGFIAHPVALAVKAGECFGNHDAREGVPAPWLSWCQRWKDTSTSAPRSRMGTYYSLLTAGRWLAQAHSEVVSPDQWTRKLAAEYVAVVTHMKIGEWAQANKMYAGRIGQPLSARARDRHLASMRIFFRDCQEWEWMPRRFDSRRSFATPRSIRALITPDPRFIADEVWAKLVWAGLNLTAEDLSASLYQSGSLHEQREPWYPLAMMRAMVITWLFAGLRSDELRRLCVGCIRWQRDNMVVPGSNEILPPDAVCWLDVPVNKTSAAFTKAVDLVVGEAIVAWEQIRPSQPAAIDSKTGEMVHYLFMYRGQQLGKTYLNHSVIPLLCRKANIPKRDARGDITSHRARSTIATQLYNAKEPLSLFELQEWLGHRLLSSTQAYAKKSPTKVAKAYEKAGYFGRNMRTIEVLINQEVIKSGAAANGEPWRFFDLGHGYCLYEFFDACPHRMACAKCSFYRPKGSTQAQLLEGKTNLLHMLQEIPLSEEERAAVEEGVEAMETLCQQLADVPTPAGPTPNQLSAGRNEMKKIIPVERVQRKQQSK
ncbi:integrase [Ktedonobacteria bacterium brp13]|nr:integrase [Ktedonobacteria bacterium brp13]BCL81029.1 integrase [Ktedonobacteria bacterium brp13]